jgi:hypothetical protein
MATAFDHGKNDSSDLRVSDKYSPRNKKEYMSFSVLRYRGALKLFSTTRDVVGCFVFFLVSIQKLSNQRFSLMPRCRRLGFFFILEWPTIISSVVQRFFHRGGSSSSVAVSSSTTGKAAAVVALRLNIAACKLVSAMAAK